jgi:hypothetical protein
VKRFGRTPLGNPTFYVSRLIFFESSVILVEVKFDASGKSPSSGTRVPLINQTYLTWDGKRLNWFSILHSTQSDGSGLMTVSDPGFTPIFGPYGKKSPADYFIGKTFGVIKETLSEIEQGCDELNKIRNCCLT